MIAPTLNAISQKQHGEFKAVDYRAKDDHNNWRKEIYAPEDGTITAYIPDGTSVGKQIQMQGAAGRHGFAHTESMSVSVGAHVKKGQLIGIMGWTGLVDPPNINGTHVHHTIRRSDGTYVYPPSLITEDINDYIKEVQVMDYDTLNRLWPAFFGSNRKEGQGDEYIGLAVNEVVKQLEASDPYKARKTYIANFPKDYQARVDEIAELKKLIGSSPVSLKPGIYEVKE